MGSITSKNTPFIGRLFSYISLMDRYLISELIPPFLFGIGIFSSIGVTIGSLFDLMRQTVEANLPLTIVFKVLALNLPQFMIYAFPTAVLLAALLTYSRLAGDSELVALRSCGVSVYRLMIPALILSFVITGVTFAFNEYVVPAANYEAKRTLASALNQERKDFQDSNIFYPEYGTVTDKDGNSRQALTRLFYAQEFNGSKMQGLTILDWSQQGLNQIVTSQSASWNAPENTWDFYDGTIYLIAPDASYRNIVRFKHQQLKLPRTALDFAENQRDYSEMNLQQSLERLRIEQLSGNEKRIRKLLIRIQQKISLPFACMVFGLVGAALAIRPQRTNKATGFGISLLVFFAYYLTASVGDALGLSYYLSPVMAAWLPNVFGFVAGSWILIRAAR